VNYPLQTPFSSTWPTLSCTEATSLEVINLLVDELQFTIEKKRTFTLGLHARNQKFHHITQATYTITLAGRSCNETSVYPRKRETGFKKTATWAVRHTTSWGCRDPHCRPPHSALCNSRWRSGVGVAMATEVWRLRRRASKRDRSGSGVQYHLNA
jgi:hypothetical protein